MALLILSFIAGVLTVAAPCVLPFLPIIIGGSLAESSNQKQQKQWHRPLIIAGSLAISIIVFTLLIKATTLLLGISQVVWQIISGVIILLLGIHYLWPRFWNSFSSNSGFLSKSNLILGSASRKRGIAGPILIGSSLGPVFSSCSPTYALIVATVLPVSFINGLAYLIAYAIGMSMTLLLIAYLGQAFTSKLHWISNPNGKFKKYIGIAFIAVAIMIIFGLDKKLQTYILDQGWYDPISNIEKRLSN